MTAPRRQRLLWLEALRILAAFLVIVNHTNSRVFQQSNPGCLSWHLSIAWYYLSKLAVPVYVMISGAVMLRQQDGLKKTLRRVLRVLAALVCASYVYFLYDAWVNWGLWPRAIRLDVLFSQIVRMQVTDGFWYLYFYLLVLVTMPLWQWLHRRMTERQRLCLIAFCFSLNAALPLIGHYVPRLNIPESILAWVPLGYLGLLFAGDQVRHMRPGRHTPWRAAAVLLLSLVAAWALTWLEFTRVEPGQKYWFMDHRMVPALPVICEAVAVMVLAKCIGERCCEKARRQTAAPGVPLAEAAPQGQPSRPARMLAELGGCAFGIYLLQDLFIAESEHRLFEPLCRLMPPMAAVLVWELAVFAAALPVVWLLRRIPPVRNIL